MQFSGFFCESTSRLVHIKKSTKNSFIEQFAQTKMVIITKSRENLILSIFSLST